LVDNDLPLVTLVIKSLDHKKVESLSDSQKMLVETLSMLCSFLSVKDFCSFIFSEKFDDLIECDLNLSFEIGLYTNHEVTLQLTINNERLIIEDLHGDGYIDDSRIECVSSDDFEATISNWLAAALS
tara:strand:- start:516 stop:896 length:381 start_codon:yes stop_codon:yes gene_type:complete